jgi:uncharacterized membrane protein
MEHPRTDDTRSFAATLAPRERRLAARLEGFGDIVFGFAVSQCALQLPYANGHVSLAQPISLLLYFGTFALLASLWMTYHRLLSGSYRPRQIDLFLAFAYLALVSLMPYAMYSITHEEESLAAARSALAEYSSLFAAIMALASVLTLRNLRRGWWTLDDEERDITWMAFARRCTLCVIMTIGLAVDLTLGPSASGIPFFAIFPAMMLIRMRFSKAPTTDRLRLRAPAPLN